MACISLDVKSHEGHPPSGSDSNVTAAVDTPHCQVKLHGTESICKSATDLPGTKVTAEVMVTGIPVMTCVPKVEVEGPDEVQGTADLQRD